MAPLQPPIRSVMIFAEDTRAVAAWWAKALGVDAVHVDPHEQGDFVWIEAEGVEIGFHVADPAKNPTGGSPVVYWSVTSVALARAELLAAGATPHRGPIAVDAGRSICQLRDPFGTVFGLDGPP